MSGGRLAQVALCSRDLPQTVRVFAHGLGFAPAGGRVVWGPRVARIQALPDDMRFVLWWLVGAQELFQLEVFTHTNPPQRPRPVADLGWTGLGVAVADVDAAHAALTALGVAADAPAEGRFRFREPGSDVDVDVFGDGDDLPGGRVERIRAGRPAIASATLAVADLDAARRLYVAALGLEELPHPTADGFYARAGDRVVEVVRPPGEPRPLPADHRLSDQGMMNAAIGYRSRAEVEAAVAAVQAAGFVPNAPISPSGATYVADGQGTTVELLGVEPERDAAMGFIPDEERR